MVVAAFPIAKLGFLLMKQMSKPIANFITKNAKSHPFFRRYVCLPPARAWYWCEMQAKLHVRGKWRLAKVEKMKEDEEAIELGANLLGEMILFTILSVLLILEMNRQGDKKAEKEKVKEEELVNLVETVIVLVNDVHDLKKMLKEREVQDEDSSMEQLYSLKDKLSTGTTRGLHTQHDDYTHSYDWGELGDAYVEVE